MQFRDLQAQYMQYKNEIDSAIQRVLLSASFINGKEVAELELQLADYLGVRHCISCANGTEAMTLVMMAWGIKKGDAVFVPDFTFFSTGEVVSFVGATPIFVDVDRDTFNLDADKLEYSIARTLAEGILAPKAVIPVNLFGLPANHQEIRRVAEKFNLRILEDSAQGFGGSIGGKKAGSFGDASTTSFFPSKPLGCYGDGGAIFTDDDSLSMLLTSLKVHGKGTDKYDNVRIGVNSRLDTLQAAILKVKFDALVGRELQDVNQVAAFYNEYLEGIVDTPIVPVGYFSSYAQYTVKFSNRVMRDKAQIRLSDHGIPSTVFYKKPMHKQGAFADLRSNDCDYTVTNSLCDTVLSLPMHPYMSRVDVQMVSQVVAQVVSDSRSCAD